MMGGGFCLWICFLFLCVEGADVETGGDHDVEHRVVGFLACGGRGRGM